MSTDLPISFIFKVIHVSEGVTCVELRHNMWWLAKLIGSRCPYTSVSHLWCSSVWCYNCTWFFIFFLWSSTCSTIFARGNKLKVLQWLIESFLTLRSRFPLTKCTAFICWRNHWILEEIRRCCTLHKVFCEHCHAALNVIILRIRLWSGFIDAVWYQEREATLFDDTRITTSRVENIRKASILYSPKRILDSASIRGIIVRHDIDVRGAVGLSALHC